MLNTYALFIDLPLDTKGYIVRMFDDGEDYETVVINTRYNFEQNRETIRHELEHYEEKDFDNEDLDVNEVEWKRHK